MRYIGEPASFAETIECLARVSILRYLYGVTLTVHPESRLILDEAWTTTRVAEVFSAVRAINDAMHQSSVSVSFLQAFGNTTLRLLSGNTEIPDGCASTTSGTDTNIIDWDQCVVDDPYSNYNVVHEFGHVLQFRNDGYSQAEAPREIWRLMVLWSGKKVFRTDPNAGFASNDRQNMSTIDDDEQVADMFLFWVYPGLEFSGDELGQLRQDFVNGFENRVFKDDSQSITITSLGMKRWIERTAGTATNTASWMAWPVSLRQAIVEQCVELPFVIPSLLV
jgi:hypothetical protein